MLDELDLDHDLPPLGASDAELAHLLRLMRGRLATAAEVDALRHDLLRERLLRDDLVAADDVRAADHAAAGEREAAAALRQLMDNQEWRTREDEWDRLHARNAKVRHERLLRSMAARRAAREARRRRRAAPPPLIVELLGSAEARLAILMLQCGAALLPATVAMVRYRAHEAALDFLRYGPLLPLPQREFSAVVVAYAAGKAVGRVGPADLARADGILPWQVIALLNAMHPQQAAEAALEWRRLAEADSPPARVALRRMVELGAAVSAAHPQAMGASAGAPLGLLPLPPVDPAEAGTGGPEVRPW